MDSGKSRSKRTKSKAAKPGKRGVRGKSASRAASLSDRAPVNPDERHQMIAVAAYYRAEQRGFTHGDPVQDWLEAETEVAMRLQEMVDRKLVS